MKHAEMHIDRILFLEGVPVVSNLNKMHIGTNVEEQLKYDHESEAGAIKGYNEAIALAVEVGDNGTKEFLDAILKDEEKHIDWIETQLDQIGQMGVQNYLAKQ
jgi:bacterioferritin